MNWGWVTLALVTLLAVPAGGRGLTVTITAGRMEADATGGWVVAERQVTVTDGHVRFVGQRLAFNWRLGQGLLIAGRGRIEPGLLEAGRVLFRVSGNRITAVTGFGDASFEAHGGVLFAERIELGIAQRALRASGDVRIFVPPDVVAFGQSLVYDARADRVVLAGPVKVQGGAGGLTGSELWMQGVLGKPEVVVSGEVRFDYVEGRGRAGRARLLAAEHRAVLEGEVFVEHGRQRLWAQRVILFYRERRLVAERVRRLLVEEAGTEPDVRLSRP